MASNTTSSSSFSSSPATTTASAPPPLACLGCKTRKKGCDKKLPSCGQCSGRGVICHYVAPTASREAAEFNQNVPGTGLMPTIDDEVPRSHPSIKSSLLLGDAFLNHIPAVVSAHSVIHLQVCQTIWAFGDSVDDISARYFRGIHRWLPVISRCRFLDRLVDSWSPATADFSLLLLTMCLITSQSARDPYFSAGDQETLYLTTKMLFAHAQACVAISVDLIQAGLLIATYEYGHGLTNAAYISIGTCARMAAVANLPTPQTHQVPSDDQSWFKREEEKNLWWGLLICERFIMSETTLADRPFAVHFPNVDSDLPLNINVLEQTSRADANLAHQPVSAFDSVTVDSFGREVQAIYLYTKTLEILRCKNPISAQSELSRMDKDLQKFFRNIIFQCGTTWGLYCGSIAFVIGALFSLHEYIVSNTNDSVEQETLHKSSRAALGTTVRMVVDVARSFNKNHPILDVESLPPRCSHLLRAAHHLFVTFDDVSCVERCADIDEIMKMLRCIAERWGIAKQMLATLDNQYAVQAVVE